MVTIGDDLQPSCLVDRLLTGLGQPRIRLGYIAICLWGASERKLGKACNQTYSSRKTRREKG